MTRIHTGLINSRVSYYRGYSLSKMACRAFKYVTTDTIEQYSYTLDKWPKIIEKIT